MSKLPLSFALRFTLLVGLLVAAAALLVWHLYNLQVANHERYLERAREEHWAATKIVPRRGAILDRQGRPLAVSDYAADLYFNPLYGHDVFVEVARRLAPVLDTSEAELLARWPAGTDRRFALAEGLDYETGRRVGQLGLQGVEVRAVPQRRYPEGSLASSVLGFVGKDHQGLAGIEESFELELAGTPGTVIFERDGDGRAIPVGLRQVVPPVPGADLMLTIDAYVQRLAEQELDRALAEHNAKGGTVLIMEPQTGDILAMISRPSFDREKLSLLDGTQADLYRNRAVTDTYEPGSVFKVFTMAAALDSHLVSPMTQVYDEGKVDSYGWTITNYDGKANGLINMVELLQHSSNVGAVWLASLLGPERFYDYVTAFRFGQPTDVGLSGEAPGRVRLPQDPDWSPVDLSTNAFGQGLAVTPLQMATAICAVANGGRLVRPHLVRKVLTPDSERIFEPEVVRRVISEETAATLRWMLQEVVEGGQARYATVPGYTVGGKTGTASLVPEGAYGYDKERTIASFAGFGPVEDPRFVILVKIDEPEDVPWGSRVAAPVFSRLARQLFAYYGIPPSQTIAKAGGNDPS